MRNILFLILATGLMPGCHGQNRTTDSTTEFPLVDPLGCIESGGVYFGSVQCDQEDIAIVPMAECFEGNVTYELFWILPNFENGLLKDVDEVRGHFEIGKTRDFLGWTIYCLIIPMIEVEDEHEDINIKFPCQYSLWSSNGGQSWKSISDGILKSYEDYCDLKLAAFD